MPPNPSNSQWQRRALLLWLALHVVGCGSTNRPEYRGRYERIEQALADGLYGEAVRDAGVLRTEMEAERGRDSLEFAQTLDLLATALLRNGQAGEASSLAIAEKAVSLKRSRAGPLELAKSLDLLGAIHTDRGEFQLAIPFHQQAAVIRRNHLHLDDSGLTGSLDGLALALIRLERFDEARQRLDEAQAIHARTRPQSSPLAQAQTLALVALLKRSQGLYSEALRDLDRAVALQQSISPDHPDRAATFHIRGDILWLQGDIARAQQAWAEALSVGERALSPNHPTIAVYLRKLGVAAEALGDLSEGRRLRERGLRIGDAALAPCHPERPSLLNDLADSLSYDGEYPDAQKLYERARTIYEECLGRNHSLTATVVHNQGILAYRIGDLKEAARFQQLAIDLWSAALGQDHPYVARAIDALAEVWIARGDYPRAQTLYERSLAIRRRAGGPQHPDVAWTLTNLARTMAEADDIERAVRYADEAVQIYGRAGGNDDPDHLARVLELRGSLEARLGRLSAARETLAEVLRIRRGTFGPKHPLVARTLADFAAVELWSDVDAALKRALDAEALGREHLQFTVRYLPERQAMAYASARPRGLALALTILTERKPATAAPVLESLMRSRGVILDEFAARARIATTDHPDTASLNADLIAARQRFANLALRSLQDTETVSPLLMDEARSEKERAERAFAERSASNRSQGAGAEIGHTQLRSLLPDGTALVSFVRYEHLNSVGKRTTDDYWRSTPRYLAFVTRKSGPIAVVSLGPAAPIESAVTAWRKEMEPAAVLQRAPAEAERSARQAGDRLRAVVWDPLAKHVAGSTRILVVPDGALNLVNFAALPAQTDGYLVELSAEFHYLSTERDLILAEGRVGVGLLAVGGVAFDDSHFKRAAVSAAGSNGPAKNRVRTADDVLKAPQRSPCIAAGSSAMRFGPLPATSTEVSEIGQLWPSSTANEVAVLTGGAADERTFRQSVVGRQVVHLATHAFILDSPCVSAASTTRAVGGISAASRTSIDALADNPLLSTGLALSGANAFLESGASEEDGILTGEEAAALNLQGVQWAVLSACETGVGAVKSGEGVFGLRRAFHVAGARTVIMSLWQVSDEATRQWMRLLYEARLVRRLDTADSVRAASLSVLQNRRQRGLSTHPFFWAAFVAAGDWR